MANNTRTSIDPILKQIYVPDNYRESTYKNRPFYALLGKMENFGGRNMPLVNKYGSGQGISATFSTAQSNATAMKFEDFLITHVNLHGVAAVDGDAIDSTANDDHAFLKSLTDAIDDALDALAESLETYIPRTGTGSLGVISSGSTVTNKTVTLATITDAHNFEVGMTLKAASSATAAVRASSEVLAGVNRITGVITATSAQWDTAITAIAAGDHLFREGAAYNNSANAVITGLESWIPATAPSASESFFGVDRSVDSRLYGVYYDGSSGSTREALINGQSRAAEHGGMTDQFFVHNSSFRKLKVELGGQEFFQKHAELPDDGGKSANISFQSLQVAGDSGPIDVTPARKCQSTIAWGLEMDTVKLISMGPAVKLNDSDGLGMLRQSTADGVEVRVVSRAQIGVKKPGSNCHILVPT